MAEVTQIGSVGSLVAAAMETAGHHVQSLMLDELQQGLARSLGALLYTIAVISALLIIAVGGRYKFGLWLLLGPPLFFFIISARVDSAGARYRFAIRSAVQSEVTQAARGTIPESAARDGATTKSVGRVSTLFAVWDILTSSVVNLLVNVTRPHPLSDQEFVSRTERYESLFHLKIADPALKQWVDAIMIAPCADYFLTLKAGISPAYDHVRREDLLKAADQAAQVRVNLSSYPALLKWPETDPAIKPIWQDFLKTSKASPTQPTCGELWIVTSKFAALHAKELVEQMARAYSGPLLSSDRVIERFMQKIDSKQDVGGVETTLTNEQKALVLFNEIGGRLILHELAQINPNNLTPAKTPRLVSTLGLKNFEEDTAREIRAMSATDEYQGKGDFLAAMLALPYIQGLLLYVLAFTFPFFALCLVVPGRHHAMLLWLNLWFWAKSWDFGVAVVMYVDELLYALLPHSPSAVAQAVLNPAASAGAFHESASNMIKALLEVDPTYSVHTYYTLIATLILAVPAVTAALCKKGGGEVLDAIQQGFHNFSGKIGGAMASYACSLKAQSLAAEVKQNVYAATERAFFDALKDPEVISALGGSIAFQSAARGAKSAAGQTPDFMQQLFQDLSKGAGDQAKRIALEKIKFRMEDAAYRESISLENQRRAADAVMQRYYSHDFSNPPPGAAALEVLKMYYYFPIGSEITKDMRKAAKELSRSGAKGMAPKPRGGG